MTGDNMKSGVVESDRVKLDGRQSLHRRKNTPIVNGAASESVGYEDEIRQVNLAAAYHDHISCTKSADLCKIPDTKEGRANLPCETDHIYANCSDKSKSHGMVTNTSPSKDKNDEKRQLHDMCLLQLELIKHLEDENGAKDKQLKALKQENEMLKMRQERMERRVNLMKRSGKSDDETENNLSVNSSLLSDSIVPGSETSASSDGGAVNTHPPMKLMTRYFGRKSKTIPSRALKRRYFPPPKSPCKKVDIKPSSSTASIPESQTESHTSLTERMDAPNIVIPSLSQSADELKKVYKKRGRRCKQIPRDFLTTDKEYYLPDFYHSQNQFDYTENIDVPSWRFRPIPSFYQMEGTENIDDRVFQRRHLRCETDEKRRKRWDIQRLREQKALEKPRQPKQENEDFVLWRRPESLYHNPSSFTHVEVTNDLPVTAFGETIPLFQPSEFGLPWKVNEFQEMNKTRKSSTSARLT